MITVIISRIQLLKDGWAEVFLAGCWPEASVRSSPCGLLCSPAPHFSRVGTPAEQGKDGVRQETFSSLILGATTYYFCYNILLSLFKRSTFFAFCCI